MTSRSSLNRSVVLIPFVLAAASCGGGGSSSNGKNPTSPPISVTPPPPGTSTPPPTPTPTPSAPTDTQNLANSSGGWSFGPTIGGVNRSAGTSFTDEPGGGFSVNIPYPDRAAGTAGYITRETASLANATSVYIDFELIADPGVKLMPRDGSGLPSLLTLYFQRRGDNWFADGATETYRWWASPKTVVGIEAGRRYTVRHRFDELWTAVLTSSSQTNSTAFAQARANAGVIGFTLGGGDGLGHGLYATGPAKIKVHEFRVE